MAEAVVRVKVIGDNLQFVQDMEKTRKSVDGVRGSVDSLSKSLGAIRASAIVYLATSAIHAAERMYAFGKSIASAANDIERIAKTVGISTDEWQKFAYAAKMSDVSVDSLMRGMKALSQSMEEFNKKSGDGYEILTALGLSTIDTSGKQKTLTQMFKEVATEFSKYESGARMVDYTNKLLGKSGMELIPMFEKGGRGIDEYGEKLVRMGSIIGEVSLKAGSAAENEFKDLETRMNSIKISFAPLILQFAKGAENLASMVKWITTPITIPWWLGGGRFSLTGGFEPKQKEMPVPSEYLKSHGPDYVSTIKKILPPLPGKGIGKSIDDALKLEQKMLEENARAWGDYADEVLNSLEKMQMDIIENQKKMNAEIDELLKQGEQSWLESIDAKFDADFDYYNKIAELQREKNKQDEETAKHSAEMALKAKEMMPSWKKEIAELIGNYDLMMQAEKEILQIEMERIIRENELTGIYKEQVEILYKQKQAIVEAQRTMNIPALVNLGAQQASIDYNRQLADQYMKLIPNALNIGQGALTGFFDNLRSGTMSAGDAFKKMADDFVGNIMRMIEEIGFLIIKMEILKAMNINTTGGGSWLGQLLGVGASTVGGMGSINWGSAYGLTEGNVLSQGVYAQGGAEFWANKPTHLIVGEGGQPERVQVTPKSKMGMDEREGQRIVNITNHFTISSPDGNISRYSQDQIAQKAAIGIQRAMRKM